MTSQKDKIQSLIADIEQILETQRPKKLWVRASDMEPQRQALAKVQTYLQSLQTSFDAPDGWGPVDPATGELIAPDRATSADESSASGIFSDQPAPLDGTPEDVLQSLLTEMKFLRSSALEPLRLEMDGLRRERDGLQQEIEDLAAQRSALVPSSAGDASFTGAKATSDEQLNAFLAALMERLQERLSVQVTETLSQLETDYAEAIAQLTEATDAEVLQLKPAGRSLEEMRQLQARSDQLLVNIESTLQGMYETLQKNIDSYQISLNEGIENMHSLGRQGEVIVRSLVDHLTHQLGQTAPPEPAFFPSPSDPSTLTYALADSPDAEDLSSSEASPSAAVIAAAITDSEAEDSSNDIVSSLDEILPANTSYETADETADEDALVQGSLFEERDETSALIDAVDEADEISEADQTDVKGIEEPEEITLEEVQLEDAKLEEPDSEAPSPEAPGLKVLEPKETEPAEAAISASSSDLAPEDCIREDGTIDLDLLKLDIDRADGESELAAEDVMIDAAIADAQVAAVESEDPEIEAKVTPTADAAYLAELTLDDLTSVEDFSADADADAVDLSSLLPDLGEPLSDVNNGESLFPSVEVEERNGEDHDGESSDEKTILAAPFASAALIAETDAEANAADAGAVNTDSADTESTTSATADANRAELMAAAALGAAAAVKAERSNESDVSADALLLDTPDELDPNALDPNALDLWDSSIMDVPDSAKVPDIPDAQDSKPDEVDIEPDVETDAETAAETENKALQSIDDTVSSELAAQLEADSLRADQIAASAVRAGLEAVSTLTPDLEEPVVSEADMPAPTRLSDETEPMESSKIPDWPDDETESDAAYGSGVSDATAAAANAPQFVDGDPFEEDPIEEDLVEEYPVEDDTTVSTDFDDDLDAHKTSSLKPENAADRAADDLLERLSIESVDDSDAAGLLDQSGDMPTEIAPTDIESVEGLPDFPELPPITPPLPDTSAPDATAMLIEAPVSPEAVLSEVSPKEVSPKEVSPEDDAADQSLNETDRAEDLDDGEDDPTDGQPASWFLGIDLGTTGLSAVLLNRLGEQVYPLYWQRAEGDRFVEQAPEQSGNKTARNDSDAGEGQYGLFRLPVVLQLESNETTQRDNSAADLAVGAVGLDALRSEQSLRMIKPLLKVGIPQAADSSPLIQWSDHNVLPLADIQAALTQLLSTLSPNNLACKAIDLKTSALRRILTSLEGVAVGYPNNWPDTYSFNIREAVLAAGIVSQPDQIFFVEEAIAALLSALPDPQMELDEADPPSLYNCNWQGGTVIISAGATLTEAGVIDLPTELDQLIYRDFALRSFTYAGDSLDQDIICQLLHAPTQQTETEATSDTASASGWDSLGLHRLQLPQPGEADRIKRHRLRQRLNDSPLGREVLAAARDLKMVLQEETQCELTLAGQSWLVKRKDLETKVFIPYIQRVNRQINSLLNQKGLSAQSIKQVICTGGSAALGAIARWLRQKFPNATIIQDTYSGEYSNSCSRVAYGLANLCNYPHVLDAHRHQYNDYFLLLELLRVLPDQPLPAGGILHLLEQRGVNVQACQSHILALIEGHLPPGLVPTEGDRPLISAQSANIETYRALSELPLFRKQGGQIYIADEAQGDHLRQHLEALLLTKYQTLSQPLSAALVKEEV